METVWFMIVAFMLVCYVILDGFDIGAGIVHYFVGRDDRERATVIRAIGPVWDGNEVWLARHRRDVVFCVSTIVLGRVQRVLFAADNGSLAADHAGRGNRTASSARQSSLDELLGFCILALEHFAGDIFRGCVGQRHSRCAARRRPAISSSRCLPIGARPARPASSTGLRCFRGLSRLSRSRCTAPITWP